MFNKLTSAFAVGSFAVCAAIAGTLISTPKADAASNYCYTTDTNNTVCIHSVRSHKTLGGDRKLVVASINGGRRDTITVDCTTASASNYKENLYGIACYQFN